MADKPSSTPDIAMTLALLVISTGSVKETWSGHFWQTLSAGTKCVESSVIVSNRTTFSGKEEGSFFLLKMYIAACLIPSSPGRHRVSADFSVDVPASESSINSAMVISLLCLESKRNRSLLVWKRYHLAMHLCRQDVLPWLQLQCHNLPRMLYVTNSLPKLLHGNALGSNTDKYSEWSPPRSTRVTSGAEFWIARSRWLRHLDFISFPIRFMATSSVSRSGFRSSRPMWVEQKSTERRWGHWLSGKPLFFWKSEIIWHRSTSHIISCSSPNVFLRTWIGMAVFW